MSDRKRRDSKGRVLHTGEFQKPDGSYIYRYTEFGKRITLSSWQLTRADTTPEGKKVKPPLREQEEEVKKRQMQGYYASNITVCDQVDKYLSLNTHKWAPSTVNGYLRIARQLRDYGFGQMRITQVRYSDALSFLTLLKTSGYKTATVNCFRKVLSQAFELAMRDNIIPSNPFSYRMTGFENDKENREAVSREDEARFLDFIKSDPVYKSYYECIYILFHTGLRISEFCGLTVSDINFENHSITVDHQLLYDKIDGKHKLYIDSPKTHMGKRVLPMEDDVESCFQTLVQNRRNSIVPEFSVDGYSKFLYTSKNGKPYKGETWDGIFNKIELKYSKCHDSPLPHITPHICRHTYCTNMAAAGINPKTLQYLMGHSDISTTLNIYTHIRLGDVREELARISKNLNNAGMSGRDDE